MSKHHRRKGLPQRAPHRLPWFVASGNHLTMEKSEFQGLLVLVLRTFIKELGPRESEATPPFLVLWPNRQRVADVTDSRATADKALFGRC